MSARRRKRDGEVSARRDLVPAEPPEQLIVAKSGDFVVFAFPIPAPALPSTLSPAEREVVELALRGLSNAQIAERRACAVRTIANQLASVFRKLEVRSRTELVARFLGSNRDL